MTALSKGFFDADLASLIVRCPWFVSGYDCLITCLDSDPNTAEPMTKHFPKGSVRTLGPFGLVDGDLLTASDKIFFGFDEMFVLRLNHGNLNVRLYNEHYTSDVLDLGKQEIPNALSALFVQWGAEQYASDGLGLNVIASQLNTITMIRSELSTPSMQ